jgi:hypothetical protein
MCVVAVYALTIFHLGFLFKESYAALKMRSSSSGDTHPQEGQSVQMTWISQFRYRSVEETLKFGSRHTAMQH